jgi:hypothetical protein
MSRLRATGMALGAALALGLLAACAPAPPPDTGASSGIVAPGPGQAEAPLRWRAVLVAGDPSLPVWDNATRRLEAGLLAGGAAVPGAVTRISAQPKEAGALTGGKALALARIAALRPGPGEGCLVFLTMHGARQAGLVFVPGPEILVPAELDAALEQGCGTAPTLVVASGCYTGGFASGRMARPNRVVLAAASPDRSSFGCGAGFRYTVFDDCLLRALEPGGPVRAAWGRALGCVQAEEARQGMSPPSAPVLHEGAALRGIALPPIAARGA